MKIKMKEDIQHTANELFKASESIREALDTIDLKNIPFDESLKVALENCGNFLEKTAQKLQKKTLD